MGYNSKQVLKQNIEALRIALNWDGRSPLLESEIEALKSYKGFGGIKAILYNPLNDADWHDASKVDKALRADVQELYELVADSYPEVWEKIIGSLKASILTAYYTPAIVPATFYQVLKEYTTIKSLYEPSAGAGIFITAAKDILDLEYIVAYEKDTLTAKVLQHVVPYTWNDGISSPSMVTNRAFEDNDPGEEGFDIITSNIPFGAFPIYDPECTDKNIYGKIHNYFFWKGLQKIKDGGILAYLTTNAFLDSPSNKTARKHLFSNSDFISLTVMPDNLMKEEANTEAPSHFLVVRKRKGKTEADMSQEEKWLCEATNVTIKGVPVAVNEYVKRNRCTIGKQVLGKNQYGKAAIEVLWDKPIVDIAEPFEAILRADMEKRYKRILPWNRENIDAVISQLPAVPCKALKEEPGELNANWERIETKGGIEEEEHTCDNCGTAIWDLSEKLCPECTLEEEELNDALPQISEEEAERRLQALVNMMADKHGLPRPDLSGKEEWQKLQDDVQIEDEEISLEPSTCCGCGVGMFGSEPFCYKCKEEGRTLSSVEDSWSQNLELDESVAEQSPEDKVENLYGCKPGRETEIMQAAIEVINAYNELSKAEDDERES